LGAPLFPPEQSCFAGFFSFFSPNHEYQKENDKLLAYMGSSLFPPEHSCITVNIGFPFLYHFNADKKMIYTLLFHLISPPPFFLV
jgi:hypothetical protein